MKRNSLSISAAATAIGMLCGALLIPVSSFAGGAVKVNGGQVCASSTNISLDPAGDLVINCTAPIAGGGGATSPPVCTVNVSPASITAGQTANISAICNPPATSFSWTVTNGGPAVSASGATVGFPTMGTFAYSVTGTNSNGPGLPSPGVAVVVGPAVVGGGGGGGNCVASTVTGAFSGGGNKLIAIDRGSSVAFSLPVYTSAGRTVEFWSVQSTASQSDLTAEFALSTCPGDFTNVPAECKTWGTVNQGGTQLMATTSTSGSPYPGTCTLIAGQQYYISVRNTKYDRVTPACTPQTCYMVLQLNTY